MTASRPVPRAVRPACPATAPETILTRTSGIFAEAGMTSTQVRIANPMAPALPPLTPDGELALLCRMLFREGYDDHLAGHITYKQADDTLLVNPWGLTWDEVRASDMMRIDL